MGVSKILSRVRQDKGVTKKFYKRSSVLKKLEDKKLYLMAVGAWNEYKNSGLPASSLEEVSERLGLDN
ncbi:MAG: hypothetical protein IJR94_03825 [Synergistaceae bacterium]|nr:hypothetical protein [Synergistaceae bacterium]